MVETVIQVKIGITINVDVSAKIRQKIMCGKKIIFGIAVHVMKMRNIQKGDKNCSNKNYYKKTIATNLNQKNVSCKIGSPFY